ncbi:helix-turn-helix transcriptional regulator [Fulvivirgaceae bacterium BMA12]|uniref:Helix-turn-helix transcriptional regulator n=1 Tax=Agaribacillus aureus TaxID=3051825 RepID=A0ABT8LEC3_9BACT|nr:helix-turn-helix transcriptional regulator [Fulvivirgaceae bacterium BMA12]
MSYQEFKPNSQLHDLIDCYWQSEAPASGISRVLPDGCADLIFNFGGTISNAADNGVSVAKESIAAIGMMTTFRDVVAPSGSNLLGIRFKAGGLSLLTRTSLSEFKNTTVPAGEVIPELNDAFLQELHAITATGERIALIEKMLYSLLAHANITGDKLVTSVTDLILQSQGQIRMSAVADAACISLRQLQRRFKARVGTSLKEYAKVVRFINTSRIIKSARNKSLLEVSFERGYYDHAHLNNEFKQLGGVTPSALK